MGCKVPVWGPAGGPPAAGGVALGGYFMCQQLQAQSLTAGRKKEMSAEKQGNDDKSQHPMKPGHWETCPQFWAFLQIAPMTLDSSCNFTALVFPLLTRARIKQDLIYEHV